MWSQSLKGRGGGYYFRSYIFYFFPPSLIVFICIHIFSGVSASVGTNAGAEEEEAALDPNAQLVANLNSLNKEILEIEALLETSLR